MILVSTVLAAAIAWGAYFALKDRYEPEPRALLAFTFIAGAVATVPAWLLYRLANGWGLGSSIAYGSAGTPARLLYCILVIGVIEETCKLVPVALLIRSHPEFDEPVDGLVYASMAALGFASAENLVLGQMLGGAELWARITASPLTHALFSSLWGASLSAGRFSRPLRVRLPVGLTAAVLLHGVYDFLVLSRFPGRIAAALLILGLWIGFFVLLARMLRASPHHPVRRSRGR